MELHASDAAGIEGALAKSMRILSTFQKHLGSILRPEVQQAMQTTLEDIAGALLVLDPTADGKDVDEHVRSILEREGRKTVIAAARG